MIESRERIRRETSLPARGASKVPHWFDLQQGYSCQAWVGPLADPCHDDGAPLGALCQAVPRWALCDICKQRQQPRPSNGLAKRAKPGAVTRLPQPRAATMPSASSHQRVALVPPTATPCRCVSCCISAAWSALTQYRINAFPSNPSSPPSKYSPNDP